VLPIAPSTYHAHVAKRRDPARRSTRAIQDAALKIEVWRVFDQNFRVYGVRKVWRQLSILIKARSVASIRASITPTAIIISVDQAATTARFGSEINKRCMSSEPETSTGCHR
jgi:hypothetical protein